MALTILNNIAAIAAENQLNITSNSLDSTLEQLSSGSRINSGADDPAGLAIANGLEANVTALTQSASNATDGVGELQVADGALSQVTTLLDRAVTLATESATGTVSNSQRVALDSEYSSIKAEINDIGSTTNYNGGAVFTGNTLNVYLSDGSASGSSTIGVATGVLSSTSLTLGGPTQAVATLAQTPAVPAISATGTLTGATFAAATAATETLSTTGAFTAATKGTGGTFTIAAPPTLDDTVSVGSTVYTFVSSITNGTQNQVLIGNTAADTAANLTNAINGNTLDTNGDGAAGFSTSTVANTIASAAQSGNTGVTTLTAKQAGNLAITLASSAGNVTTANVAAGTAGSTVAVGGKTYTFVTAFSTGTAVANEVLSQGTQAGDIANLVNAVNNNGSAAGSSGGSGVGFSATTAANAAVTAAVASPTSSATFTTVATGTSAAATIAGAVTGAGGGAFSAATGGLGGDQVIVGGQTYTFVSQATLTATPTTADEVLVGTEAQSLSNLADAVDGVVSDSGTNYGSNTTANAIVSAVANVNGTTDTFTAITPGNAENNAGSSQIVGTLAGGSGNTGVGTWGLFSGGVNQIAAPVAQAGNTVTVGTQTYTFVAGLSATPTANQVLVGVSETASLLNLANAVNGASGAGATYSSTTPTNTFATAVAGATSVTFTAINNGTTGNAIVATSTGTSNTFVANPAVPVEGSGGGFFTGGAAGSVNDLLSASDAIAALATINAAVATVAALRGNIGGTVNRLQSASNVINNQVQNLTAAENDVTAADIPTAVANLTQYSILEQTGISALSQANQQQQLVLKLLQ